MPIPYRYDKSLFCVNLDEGRVCVEYGSFKSVTVDCERSPSIRRNFKTTYVRLLNKLSLLGVIRNPDEYDIYANCVAGSSPLIVVMSPTDCDRLRDCTHIDADINILFAQEQSVRQFYRTLDVEIYVDSHLDAADHFEVTEPRLFDDNDNWWHTPPPKFEAISFADLVTTLTGKDTACGK